MGKELLAAMRITMVCTLLLTGCSAEQEEQPEPSEEAHEVADETEADEVGEDYFYETGKIQITFGEHSFSATLADNPAAEALQEVLADGPATIDMRDYGGFEKVGLIDMNLPADDEPVTTEPGDIILYEGNSLVICYAANSWNYTRLGRIDDTTRLIEASGSGDVTVTLSLQ